MGIRRIKNLNRTYVNGILLSLSLLMVGFLTGCELSGVPEEKHESVPRSWSESDVNSVVRWEQVLINSPLSESIRDEVPPACNNIQFLRYQVDGVSNEAADADAVFMMMPGILEGASAFHHIARHMIYLAKVNHGMNYEVWAMDRRANCLEDLHGAEAIRDVDDPTLAANLIFDYYLNGETVEGKTFEGFYKSSELDFLTEFGMELSTLDMFTVMQTMMPNLQDRQERLFVGGHSLGGIHTSVFLAWDLDGDPSTLEDAGFNNVAGAFAFDSLLANLEEIPEIIEALIPFNLGALGVTVAEKVTPALYRLTVNGIRNNAISRMTSIPNLFTPVELAFPVAMAAITRIDPRAENEVLREIDIPSSTRNMMRFLHSKDLKQMGGYPDLVDFRYTNESIMGLIFDDDFTTLGFLGTSLGHLNGGVVAQKFQPIHAIAKLPLIGNFVGALIAEDRLFIADEPNSETNPGPLYEWARFDEVATLDDTEYRSTDGKVLYTRAKDEMVDMENFIDAVYEPTTSANFTEWYFPTRIVVDTALAIPFEHAVESGFNLLHSDSASDVPKIEFIGGDGVVNPLIELGIVPLSDHAFILPGQNHLDPLFEVVNAPLRHEAVVIPELIKFASINAVN